MILYFTGTGNSRFVADALADKLEDEAVDCFKYVRENLSGSFESSKPWVFVFPIYMSTIARPFAEFILRSEFRGSDKAYFAATCASAIGGAPNDCAKISAQKGFEYKGTARVQMPQNYIAMFTMTEKEECERRYSVALDEVAKIAALVKENGKIEDKPASNFEYRITKASEKMYYNSLTGTKKFFATDACIGCGKCERSCPTKNITMEGGKPKWIGKCVHCMACINSCPKAAIEIGKKTVGKTRYMCKKYKR